MLKIKESNVTVMVRDLDSAITFYERIGVSLKQRWENHYAMVAAEGITIGLHPTMNTVIGSGSLSIGFMIDEIDSARHLLASLHIPFKEENGKSGHYLHFQDPDQTILYFVKPGW